MSCEVCEYDQEALSYDESRFSRRFGKNIDYMHKKIVWTFVNSVGKTLLDVGIGTGRLAKWLAENGFGVIGIDVSKKMLKEARRKTRDSSADIHLVLGDAHFLPFKKEIFDCCICINVVNHIPEIESFLKEINQGIKPKGFFIVNFPNLKSPFFPIAIMVNLRKRALFKEEIFSRWFTLREIELLLSRSGFHIKEIRGCAIASPVPLGDELAEIIRRLNLRSENSKLKIFSGNLFIKAQPARAT